MRESDEAAINPVNPSILFVRAQPSDGGGVKRMPLVLGPLLGGIG